MRITVDIVVILDGCFDGWILFASFELICEKRWCKKVSFEHCSCYRLLSRPIFGIFNWILTVR